MNCIRTSFAVIALALFSDIDANAQDAAPVIKDNSFLIEEAYNQEAGVVQWIVTAQHFASPFRYWGLGLTNELPLHGMRHQFSWTVPVETDQSDTFRWGRVALHYRYQLLDGSRGIAIAPRVSASLATNPSYSTDSDAIEWQANLPVSIEVTDIVIMHLNVGTTYSPGHSSIARVDGALQNETLMSYALGGSIVLLAHPNLNVMTELVHASSEEFVSESKIDRSTETIVNPGIRFAINKPFGQFVPGIGIPIRMSEGETDIGVFGYLSFEHSL